MAVMIKSIKDVPKSCNRCSLRSVYDRCCAHEYDEEDPEVFPYCVNETKPEWCPLIDVPENNVGNSSEIPNGSTDCISRQAAIDALWKALYAYEDKTEKQFQNSDELDVGDWFKHRIFVQNMSDIDRQTILELPSVQPERKKGKWILDDDGIPAICSECGTNWINDYVDSRELYITGKIPNYCQECGSDNRGEQE